MNTNRQANYPLIPWSGHVARFAVASDACSVSVLEDPLQEAPDAAPEVLPVPRWKKRILLVDDDDQVLASVALVLEEENYDVVLASDGYEAMIKCQNCHPDLVLIDLNMPRLDGWKTLEVIDRLEPLVPIVVITARPQQYERAVLAGVDALMEKPLDFPVLLEAMEKLLNESREEHLSRITSREFKTWWLGAAREPGQ